MNYGDERRFSKEFLTKQLRYRMLVPPRRAHFSVGGFRPHFFFLFFDVELGRFLCTLPWAPDLFCQGLVLVGFAGGAIQKQPRKWLHVKTRTKTESLFGGVGG